MTKKIVIIGGGIAGMESAAYLNAVGYHVSIDIVGRSFWHTVVGY